jgi:peptidoglycan/LPS O-acetylase OafA/YrhL
MRFWNELAGWGPIATVQTGLSRLFSPDVTSTAALASEFHGGTLSSGRAPAEPRVIALDGFRGLLTLMVVFSHYFAEVPSGTNALACGWIAVVLFFVLSGFLVGRLILEKKDRANFFSVFYVRRLCRTIPVYVFCVGLVFAIMIAFEGAHWLDADIMFPLWSYLSFTQNFFMISTESIGPHWLAPTWTLTVEEHFYLLAPAMFFIVPRRYLVAAFSLGIVLTIVFRMAVYWFVAFSPIAALVLLPGVADTLLAGLIAGVLVKTDGIDWTRYDVSLRAAPLVALLLAGLLKVIDGESGHSFDIFGGTLVALGGAAFLIALVRGAPEAKRLESPFFCFFGHNSYSIYLTHLAILGLMHGLVLGSRPDIGGGIQILVTLMALPLCAIVGRVFTRFVEEPITAYGRSWKWSSERRSTLNPAQRTAVPAALGT